MGTNQAGLLVAVPGRPHLLPCGSAIAALFFTPVVIRMLVGLKTVAKSKLRQSVATAGSSG